MATIQFFGAARVVTGSKHLITTASGKKLLLDCGLFQGRLDNRDEMNRDFGFEPHEIDYVILSHAHIDHSGLLPRLIKLGFRGIIFATPATISLCEIMLLDSAHIQTEDLKHINKRRAKRDEEIIEPLYDVLDVEKTLDLMVPVEYDETITIDKDIQLTFTDAGHLLGSAVVNIDVNCQKGRKTKITFTGDIGRFNDQILRSPQPFRQCDILICESTYGNRLHPKTNDIETQLLNVIRKTCVEQKGKLIIPAFSVDRTQDLVYMLDKFANAGLLPKIKVFVDSPLSVKATGVIKKHDECYNETFLAYMRVDADPFGFKNLTYVSDVNQSKAINDIKEPCIIISASGMAEAGRIKHHIANNIQNPNNTILMVGYCTPESLGGRLKAGATEVKIFGEMYKVIADVVSMDYFSAHADYGEIITFLSKQKANKVQQVFLVHGELDAQESLKTKLQDIGYKNIAIPRMKETFNLGHC
ncbi:MAG: MBL fold metallo-hydrolase [Bacteroidia bacterium]|nr:MBL fold metallo-hydrolase [Bacteroidia bacterium]MBP9689860.1 MBL fold metallo-hydrolase [Bacteroidia bacterium]